MRLSRADKQLAKTVLKAVLLIGVAILGCRFTHSGLTLLIAVAGVRQALCNQLWQAIACFAFFPLLTIINVTIKGSGGNVTVMRFGLLAMALALATTAARRSGRYVLPILMIFPYLFVAFVSSIFGYAPMLSILKLVNFVALILGLWLGFQNLQSTPRQLEKIRIVFLGIISFLIIGSLLTVIFPAYGYTQGYNLLSCMSVGEVNDFLRNRSGMMLFSGVTNQSQCLGVVLPCSIAWLLCDMLFVERRVSKFHIALIFASLPLVYKTRSRTALVAMLAALAMVYGYSMHKIRIKPIIRTVIQRGMIAALGVMIIGTVAMEVKDRSVSKFLRKTGNVERDERALHEALTNSRMGLIKMSLSDFKQSPLWGTGFQVMRSDKYRKGLGGPSNIEKGVLPVMILGETGLIGVFTFLVFLVAFYGGCIRLRLVVTITLFTIFLASNLGEATFFSPGGYGGFLWVLCAGGGFVLDMLAVLRKRQDGQGAMLVPQRIIRPSVFAGTRIRIDVRNPVRAKQKACARVGVAVANVSAPRDGEKADVATVEKKPMGHWRRFLSALTNCRRTK